MSPSTSNPQKRKKYNHGASTSLKPISHALSWALRHGAPELGLRMTSDGYCPVIDLIQHPHPKLRKVTSLEEQVRPVVETNDKQRFRLTYRPAALFPLVPPNNNNAWSIIPLTPEQATPLPLPKCDPGQPLVPDTDEFLWCIRANQGHSLQGIQPEYLLHQLSPNELASLPVIVHGTYNEPWNQIVASGGLSRMNRTFIHCAAGHPGAEGVISGMRHSCQVYVYINALKCAQDGIRFYRSDNGVLLTAGVQDQGILPLDYIFSAKDKSGRTIFSTKQEEMDEGLSAKDTSGRTIFSSKQEEMDEG